jgi:heat shock protein HslJ
MKIFICLILAAAFIYAGCSGSEGTASVKSTKWELTTLMQLSSLNFKGKPTVEFTADGKVAGFGGCNNFGGSYKVSGSKLTVSDIFSTDMACDNMNVESIFLDALKKNDKYEITDSKLYLYSNGNVTAILTKASK